MRYRGSLAVVALCMSGGALASNPSTADSLRTCADAAALPSAAIASCTALIDSPTSSKSVLVFAHFNRAVANNRNANTSQTLADLGRVIELDPTSAVAYGSRGVALGESGDFEGAKRDFQMAIKLDPKDKASISNLGTNYEKQGDAAKALPFFDQALAIDPEFAGALGARCWTTAVLNQNLGRAELDCDKALALNPQDFNSFNSRGFVKFRKHQYQAAIDDYNRAIAGDPTAGSSYYVRGLAKQALGMTAEGSADIAKAIEIEPAVAKRYAGYGVGTAAVTTPQ